MKKLLLVLCLSLAGCANFTHAQVGPDRFAITSRNNEYTRLLELAYSDCRNSGRKDYVVINTLAETRGTTLIVQCVDTLPPRQAKEEKNVPTTTAPSAEAKQASQTNDASSTLQKMYQDLKDTFK